MRRPSGFGLDKRRPSESYSRTFAQNKSFAELEQLGGYFNGPGYNKMNESRTTEIETWQWDTKGSFYG